MVLALIAAATAQPALLAAPAILPVPIGFSAGEGADFPMLRDVGASVVKLTADWSEIETRQGTRTWGGLDDAINAARAVGLRVVLVLFATPRWASPATGEELNDPSIYARQPPRRLEDWEAFVAAAVERYKDRVRDWQIWPGRGLPLFRGTTREYIALLRAARVFIKAADPAARVILSTPFGMDLVDLRSLLTDAPDDFDVILLTPRGVSPDALLRPLGALWERVLAGSSKAVWLEWDPYSFGLRSSWPGQLIKLQALAKAFGIEQLIWRGDVSAITQVVLGGLALRVGRRPYAGYLTRQRALVLVFGDRDPAAVAWIGAGDEILGVEGPTTQAYTATGDARPVVTEGDTRRVAVGNEPVVLTNTPQAWVEEAQKARQAGSPPFLPPAVDFSGAPLVSTTLGRANVERGLYNQRFRTALSEATEVIEVDGVEAVRSDNSKERVYLRFDVDDTFLFFVDGRVGVEISVEVRGASAAQQLGFNIWYDSMSGYRFTPWQWVEATPGWVSYTFRLPDAAFADTWGWDFAINAVGNRSENLIVHSVTVKKVAP
ncbi:MAG: hypothetical protein AUH31_09680 [Armatimonadetes bacterium 13_1_40CM_64_14]|nr:MAG: hypothetical protein AUH31_09680 [Armatimonadetes bacterium 13_1_40CM_64_14]